MDDIPENPQPSCKLPYSKNGLEGEPRGNGNLDTKQYNCFTLFLVVLVLILGGMYFWWQAGLTFNIGRFFTAKTGTLTVQCGNTKNELTWTVDSRANFNSIQRGNVGLKNIPDCSDYWCWLPNNNYTQQVPTIGNPAKYTDTKLKKDECYEYQVKYNTELSSNAVFCPKDCNIVTTPLSPTVLPDIQCDAPTCAIPPQGCVYNSANACSCGILICAE